MVTENLSTLKIHKLSKEQYEREYANDNLDPNALYLTPEEEIPTKTSQLINDSGYITDPVFKNMGLNTVNIDDEYRHNYVVGLSESGHGTYPTNGWFTVTNYANDHFATQMAYTCIQSDDATRDVQVWVRERYYGGSWSNWNKIYTSSQLSELQQMMFSQLDSNGNATSSGISSYPTKPGIYRVTTEIEGCPTGWGTLVILNGGDAWSGYVFHMFTNGTNLWFARTADTYTVDKWNLANTTYSISKSGSTIVLTGSDGSVSSVEDSSSGTSSSSGMNRVYESTSSTSSVTISVSAKLFVITVLYGGEYKTLTFDWYGLYRSAGGYGEYTVYNISENVSMEVIMNSSTSIEFSLNNGTITHIAAYN